MFVVECFFVCLLVLLLWFEWRHFQCHINRKERSTAEKTAVYVVSDHGKDWLLSIAHFKLVEVSVGFDGSGIATRPTTRITSMTMTT